MATTWTNRGHFYVPHVTPVLVDCNFLVDNSVGLGISGLKGQGVANVFMHTTTTPVVGPNGYLNPNPAAGYILVQLADNFKALYAQDWWQSPPLSGSSILVTTGTTAGLAYVITIVGTTTVDQWIKLGLPPGVTPAVGVSFIAKATTTATGTGAIQVPAAGGTGISKIEVIGKPALSLGPIPVGGSPNVGGWITLRCMNNAFTGESYTPAGTISAGNISVAAGTAGDAVTNNAGVLNSVGGEDLTVDAQTFTGTAHTLVGTESQIITAPAAGSLIGLSFYLSQSSVTVLGE